MTEEETPETEEKEDDAMRALIQRAAGADAADAAPEQSVVPEVQRKLRVRSKGKFYSDGWSTTQSRVSYALVGVIMLLIAAVAYVLMGSINVR